MSNNLTWTNQRRKLSQLKPWERNPRKIKDKQAKRLAESFDTFGQVETIAVDPNNEILNGHQRLSVLAGQHGMDYEVDVRVASRPLAEKEREKLTVFLHRGATGEWSWSELESWDMNDLLSWGFEESDFPFDVAPVVGKDTAPQIDKAEELRVKWGVETGQMWQLGDHHKIICGDCTDRAVVERVMGGEKAELLFTDPPYGVERDKGFEGFEGFGGFGTPIARRQYADDWDSERPSKTTFDLLLSFSKSAIIFGGNFFADILPQSKHWIVWDKLNTMPTFGDCELAWTNIDRKSVKKYTVEYNGLLGKEKERFHPTQKPTKLACEIIKDYSQDNDIVADFYVGSGTTLIACHNLRRKCRAIEISEAYTAVCLQRFYDHTNILPVLLSP